MIRDELLALLREHPDEMFGRAIKRTVELVARSDEVMLRRIWREFGPRILRDLDRGERRRVMWLARGVLKAMVPIANTGRRKQVQLLGSLDLRQIASLRAVTGRTLLAQAQVLEKLAERVGSGKLGDIWLQLSAEEQEDALMALGINVGTTNAAAVCQ